ncbi:MAG: HD domain-containing protein [Bacteroidales bacterium]|nr:HD domain-containing protein [Bacteroidales bacterium]
MTNPIQNSWRLLKESLEAVTHAEELALLDQAFDEALKYCDNQTNVDGQTFIMHHLNVAEIAVNELGLGVPTVIATLFHNHQIKDEAHWKRLTETYGADAVTILSGFQKISELPTDRLSYQSDQFRKLFLSLIEDIRVILLKIAHRLYDLRNITALDEHRQHRFILEVKHLYIPITHRLGLYTIKAEFEERVMRFELPDVFAEIEGKIAASKDKQTALMEAFIQPIKKELEAHGFDCTLKWRTKSIPSIWVKMRDQKLLFEQVYDLFAMRIISKSTPKREKEDCWRIYSIVTDLYNPNPKRLRDWITTPKASGYESLHTTVEGPEGIWVEVQIRSERMDNTAEKGQAAHWLYKDKPAKREAEQWLNQVRDVLENPGQLQFNAYRKDTSGVADKIFIFTPNGDLKQLPYGSTVLDFAYEVHTEVGARCNGAKVNNKIVPIRHVLNNGDKVEILTNKRQSPKHDWLSFVVTDRAKARIKRHLKEEELKEAEIGKAELLRKLKNWKIAYTDDSINQLVKYYKLKNAIELYYRIATEKIDMLEIKRYLIGLADGEKTTVKTSTEEIVHTKPTVKHSGSDDYLVIDDSISNVTYKLARCCNPIPGDEVLGFVTINTGITIHRVNCPNARRMQERYPYRFLKVEWKQSIDHPNFNTGIKVSGKDTLGIVGEITNLISNDLKVIMRSISFDTRDGRFEGKIGLMIKDTTHLEQLMHRIGKLSGVEKVVRFD